MALGANDYFNLQIEDKELQAVLSILSDDNPTVQYHSTASTSSHGCLLDNQEDAVQPTTLPPIPLPSRDVPSTPKQVRLQRILCASSQDITKAGEFAVKVANIIIP